MNEEIKYCKFCGKEKPIKDFVKSGFCVKNICKDCNNKKQKDVYKNSKNYHKLQQENQQLKEQLERSEKARLKCLNKIKTLGKFDGENFTRSFTLWSADFNELAKMLDIDKGEIINGKY